MSGGYSHLRGYDYDRERSRTVQPSRESMYRPPPDRLSQDHHYSHSHYPSSRQPAPYPHGPPSPARSSEDGSFTNGLRNLHIDSRYTMPSPPVSTGTGRPKRNENSSSGTSSWRGQLIEFYDNALPVMGSQLETLYHAIAKYIMAASDSESSDDEREKCCLNCKQNQTDFSMGAGICARRMSWFYKKHKVSVTLSGRAKASAEKQEDFLKSIFTANPRKISTFYTALRIPHAYTQSVLNKQPMIPVLHLNGLAQYMFHTLLAFPDLEFKRLNALIKEVVHPVTRAPFSTLNPSTHIPLDKLRQYSEHGVSRLEESFDYGRKLRPKVEEVPDEFVPPNINRTDTLLEEVHGPSEPIEKPNRNSSRFARTGSGLIQDDLRPNASTPSANIKDRERMPYSSSVPQKEAIVPPPREHPREISLGGPRPPRDQRPPQPRRSSSSSSGSLGALPTRSRPQSAYYSPPPIRTPPLTPISQNAPHASHFSHGHGVPYGGVTHVDPRNVQALTRQLSSSSSGLYYDDDYTDDFIERDTDYYNPFYYEEIPSPGPFIGGGKGHTSRRGLYDPDPWSDF